MKALLYGPWITDVPPGPILGRNLCDECVRDTATALLVERGFSQIDYDSPNSGLWDSERANQFNEEYDLLCFAGGGQLIGWPCESGWMWQGDAEATRIVAPKTMLLAVGFNEGGPNDLLAGSIRTLAEGGAAISGRHLTCVQWMRRQGAKAIHVPPLAFAVPPSTTECSGSILMMPWVGQIGLVSQLQWLTGNKVRGGYRIHYDALLAEEVGLPDVAQLDHWSQFVSSIAASDGIFGAGYHFGIFAMLTGKPFVWVGGDVRHIGFVSTYNRWFDRVLWEDWTAEEIVEKLETPLPDDTAEFVSEQAESVRTGVDVLLEGLL